MILCLPAVFGMMKIWQNTRGCVNINECLSSKWISPVLVCIPSRIQWYSNRTYHITFKECRVSEKSINSYLINYSFNIFNGAFMRMTKYNSLKNFNRSRVYRQKSSVTYEPQYSNNYEKRWTERERRLSAYSSLFQLEVCLVQRALVIQIAAKFHAITLRSKSLNSFWQKHWSSIYNIAETI